MSRAELIYPIRQSIESEVSVANVDPHNKAILLRYYKVRSSEISPATLLVELIRLNEMSRLLNKKFEEATLQDIEDLVFKFNQRHKNPATQNRCRTILRNLFRWMKGCPRGEYPPEVKWIKLNKVPLVTVTADDLLSYDACVRISEFATNLRDKALFQCKLDAGCRIGEILTVRIGEVKFNDAGAVLYSDGKTGYQPIILTWSAKTLAQWINIHPFRNNPNAPLFPVLDRNKPEQLQYQSVRIAFKKCVKKAGYSRRVWLHLLKHVSSTEDAVKGLPDSYRKYKHHWSPNSKMSAVYEHLSHSIIPNIQNETWKIMTGSKKTTNDHAEEVMDLVKQCKRCEYENPRDSTYCNRCAFPLDAKKAVETMVAETKVGEFMNKLAQDPAKLEKLLAVIQDSTSND